MLLLFIIMLLIILVNSIKTSTNTNKGNNNNNPTKVFIINQEKLSVSKLGKSLTQNGYLLTSLSSLMKISQGRSEVLDCIKLNDNLLNCLNNNYNNNDNNDNNNITVRLYKAKITKDSDRYLRERVNYQKICGNNGNDNFVKVIDVSDDKIIGSSMIPKGGIIIQERGIIDLKVLSDTIGPIRGKELDILILRMTSSLARVHSCGLVWTDLKLENFVLCPIKDISEPLDNYCNNNNNNKMIEKSRYLSSDYICKAIDVESAVKERESLVDFSPETCAPELASILRRGSVSAARNRDFKINVDEPLIASKALDMWALGISILHLYLGRAPIVDRADINKSLARLEQYEQGNDDFGLAEVSDKKLARLLKSLLNKNPRFRPNILSVQLSLSLPF